MKTAYLRQMFNSYCFIFIKIQAGNRFILMQTIGFSRHFIITFASDTNIQVFYISVSTSEVVQSTRLMFNYFIQIDFNFTTCKCKGKSQNLFIEKSYKQEHAFNKFIKVFYFHHFKNI